MNIGGTRVSGTATGFTRVVCGQDTMRTSL